MLIPIRCFTCGNILADKYDYFIEEVSKLDKLREANRSEANESEVNESEMNESEVNESEVNESEANESEANRREANRREANGRGANGRGANGRGANEYKYFSKIHYKSILDNLGLTRYCCRRMLLGTCDMMDVI